jgi:hypothetical protein
MQSSPSHRNPVIDTILRMLERLARRDRNDPDLAAIGADPSA